MKEKLLFLFLFCFLGFSGIAQSFERSVLASDGASSTLGDITLDWTLGELATATLVTEDGMLTQGFHQPVLSVARVLTYENLEDYYTVQVMPNPVSTLLNIDIQSEREDRLSVELLDLNGKILNQQALEFPFQRLQFDMGIYPGGLYLVRVQTEDNKPVGLFKVNKLD
jgi:hypothetical protein